MNAPAICGACARIGTNDPSVRAHAPGCPNDPTPRPAPRAREPITLGEANKIEGYAREIANACGMVERARASSYQNTPATRRLLNRAAMDRDVALGKLAACVLAVLSRKPLPAAISGDAAKDPTP